MSAIQSLHKIKTGLKNKDYTVLKCECYLCGDDGHFALNCNKKYNNIKGNLMKMHLQTNKQNKKKPEQQ